MSETTKIGPPTQVGQAQRHHDLDKSQQPKSTKPAAGISTERAEILRRVASFRAHQVKLTRDREKYYERVQERIRTSLEMPVTPKPQ